jgi:SAM-dependent methyltransferase
MPLLPPRKIHLKQVSLLLPYTDTLVFTREKLLSVIPSGGPGDYILEIGARTEIARLLHTRLGYGHVRGCVSGHAGQVETRDAALPEGGIFTCNVDHLDLERDFYPYPSAHFKTILCLEVLETLTRDPMYMMDEIHRILRPGCHLVLTTRRYASAQIRELLENCGLEVTLLDTGEDCTCAVGRKIGPLRERYPAWLYPELHQKPE